MVFFSVVDNYMKKHKYEDLFGDEEFDFFKMIENFRKCMTIPLKSINVKDRLNKFQEYLRHGFIFSFSDRYILKSDLKELTKNNENDLNTRYIQYYLQTG